MIKNLGFWERELMTKNIDFAIIGAGIVGLSTAYFLRKKYPERKIVVLERQFPGMGASTKNAGFACIGSPSEILSDIALNGEDLAMELIKMRWEGLQLLTSIIGPEGPEKMEYKNLGSKELFLLEEKQNSVLGQIDFLNKIMESATSFKNVFKKIKNVESKGLGAFAVQCDIESQLNPVLMIHNLRNIVLSMGVQIVFGADVKSIDIKIGGIVFSDDSDMTADHVVICNNGFAKDLLKIEDLKTVRNQVLITKPLRSLPISGNYHVDEGYIYFRSYQNRILIGGARNLAMEEETTSSFGSNPEIVAYLKNFISNHIYFEDDLSYDVQWSGILGVGSSKNPIVEQMTDRTTIAVRLGGMGVAIGTYVGNKAAEMITAL